MAVHLAGIRIIGELLDAKRNALLVDIDIEDLRLHHIALVEALESGFASGFPADVGQVHETVDLLGQPDKQAKLGDVANLALDLGTGRIGGAVLFPRVAAALLETKRDAALAEVDIENHHFHLLAGRDDLARMDVLLGPAHFRDVDKAFDTGFQLDERAVVGDVGDTAFQLRANRELALDALPWVGLQLLHAERDTLGLRVEADDLYLDGLADLQGLGRVADALPCDVGDMQQAVNTAKVDERTVIGDVLDHTLKNLAFLQVRDQLGPGFGAGFFQNGAARDNDVAAAAVDLEDLERLRSAHERAEVTDRADVHLASRKEGSGAGQVDGKAALDLAEDHAGDALLLLEGCLENAPCFFATCFLARQHGLAILVFHALDIDFDLVADIDVGLLAGRRQFLQRNAAFGLQADIDDDGVAFHADDEAANDATFDVGVLAKALGEKIGKVFGCGVSRTGVFGCQINLRFRLLVPVPTVGAHGQMMSSAGDEGRTS